MVHFWASRLGMASDHPLHAGFDHAGWIEDADVILTIDAMVPWITDRHRLATGCKIIQLGPDPYFINLPMRSFPATLAIAADPAAALQAMVERSHSAERSNVKALRADLTDRIEAARRLNEKRIQAGRTTPSSVTTIVSSVFAWSTQ